MTNIKTESNKVKNKEKKPVSRKGKVSTNVTIKKVYKKKTEKPSKNKTINSDKKNTTGPLSFLKETEERLNILVACEESQAVTKALLELGHNAYSCDLLECSGGLKEKHFKKNVFDIIKDNGGTTQNGNKVDVGKWDMMIAHPPCTYLAVSGARWLHDPRPQYNGRAKKQLEAIEFVNKLWKSKIDKIVIENPVGALSTHNDSLLNNKKIAAQKGNVHKQIIQPYYFGVEEEKRTCFWMKGVEPLKKTNEVKPKARWVSKSSGKSMPQWYADAIKAKTPEERRTIRSKTFPEVAQQMAEQWAGKVIKRKNIKST